MGGPDRGLSSLPGVDRVMSELSGSGPEALVARAAREAVGSARDEALAGAAPVDLESIVGRARTNLHALQSSLLKGVINATGVVVHTNLGRVPLGPRQVAAIGEIASGYSNLELDLATGRRGSRHSGMATLLTAVIGAEAAVVTNNNAAAVLVSLASLCAGREVIISRGELIEIGGRFRIPDVMAASGAKLVEVGTTNRTHLRDYEDAIRPDTAAILKVHRSNYQVVGFTAEVDQRSLGRLARGRGVAFLYDIGSGLIERGPEWTEDEPTVVAALEDGADLVMFSADKLLGGPQAGIVAGRSELVERVSNHPLMRAVRPDKLTLAALQATLLAYLENDQTSLPIWQMTAQTSQELERRATSLSNALRDIPAAKAEAVVSESVLGGGSLPGSDIPSWAVAITHESLSADDIGRALRSGHPPVIARIEDDRLLIDMRCAPPGSDDLLTGAVRASLR